jgi:uncharacterized protein YdcH (DUF465 family)
MRTPPAMTHARAMTRLTGKDEKFMRLFGQCRRFAQEIRRFSGAAFHDKGQRNLTFLSLKDAA